MITAILPTWNEGSNIAAAVENLRRQGVGDIVVADGGSTDDTLPQAAAADRVVVGPAGRAAQMNAGAACARGDILLFLHADCLLGKGAVAALPRLLRKPGIVAGCFTMRVQEEGWGYRCIDWCATARVRLTGIAYGDQGLFLKRSVFEAVGGFPHLTFMEDVFLSRRLRRLGRIVVAPEVVYVSSRRWRKVGLVRQTLLNWTLTGLALAGVHPDRLARFYRRDRK